MIQLGAPSPRVNKLSPFPDKPSPNQSQIVFAICHNLVQISNSKNKAKFFEKYTNSVCPKLSFFNESKSVSCVPLARGRSLLMECLVWGLPPSPDRIWLLKYCCGPSVCTDVAILTAFPCTILETGRLEEIPEQSQGFLASTY